MQIEKYGRVNRSMILCNPSELLPPHRVTRSEDVDSLAMSMLQLGWDGPPLIGYYVGDGAIQLISGTHRREAAIIAGLRVPVIAYDFKKIQDLWGTDEWLGLMNPGIRVVADKVIALP